LARYLGIDWDANQLYVVSATTARGGVRVEKAVAVSGDFSLPPDTARPARAEALGRLLREQLKAAGIAPAPAVACLGRDRVIVKEVRFPPVPPAEEPALIRFQATKELTEAPEALVLDYTIKGLTGVGQERAAFAFAVRREVPAFILMVCRAAGIKLLALAPRGTGVAFCLERALGTATAATSDVGPEPSVAVLTAGEGWVDFSVVRAGNLVFTRALAAGGNLAAEVKRNLAAYAGQTQTNGRSRVQVLYVGGGDEHAALREQLHQTLGIPVHALDPFVKEPQAAVTGARGAFAGAIGLAERWAAARSTPVNFLQPKQPVQEADPEKKRVLRVALVGGLLLAAAVFGGALLLNARADRLADRKAEERELDQQILALGPEAKQIQALKEWTDGTISWLDEIYEITSRFTWLEGFRLTEVVAVPKQKAQTQRGAPRAPVKDKYVAQVTLKGEVRVKDEHWVTAFKDALNEAGHHATIDHLPGVAKGNVKPFRIKVELARKPASAFNARFEPPEPPRQRVIVVKKPAPAPAKEPEKTDKDAGKGDKKSEEKADAKGAPADKAKADAKGAQADKGKGAAGGAEKAAPKADPKINQKDDKKGAVMAPADDPDLGLEEGGQR
jgi:Tfp pilus assembly PilM family ATPase